MSAVSFGNAKELEFEKEWLRKKFPDSFIQKRGHANKFNQTKDLLNAFDFLVADKNSLNWFQVTDRKHKAEHVKKIKAAMKFLPKSQNSCWIALYKRGTKGFEVHGVLYQ